jgi:hypothetical protein
MVAMSVVSASASALDLDPNYLFDPDLTQESGVNQPCGAATDTQGFLYVANPARESSNGEIRIFDGEGGLVTSFGNEHEPCKLTVDSDGNVYVVEREARIVSGVELSVVARYEPDSFPVTASTTYAIVAEFKSIVKEPEQAFDPCATAHAVTVDPSNDHFYIGRPCAVEEYGSAAEGAPINPLIRCCIGQGVLESTRDIAVDGTSHDIYATSRFGATLPTRFRVFSFHGGTASLRCELAGTGGEPGEEFDFGIGGGLAMDQVSGDLFVYDLNKNVVEHFSGPDAGDCPQFIGLLPPPPAVLIAQQGYSDIAVDSPLSEGEPGYTSPNEGEVYVTSGTNASNSRVYAFRRTLVSPPGIDGQSVSGVSETEAVLEAKLNPGGLQAGYWFEFATQGEVEKDGYGNATRVPVPEAGLPAGVSDVLVAQPIEGLDPGVTYRFRLVASNCAAEGSLPGECMTLGEGIPGGEGDDETFSTFPAAPPQSCPNAALRTGPSKSLPNCRAYELVTPADTAGRVPTMTMLGGGFGGGGFDSWMSTPDGNSVLFGSNNGSLPGVGGGGFKDVYRALRDPDLGWSTQLAGMSGAQAQNPYPGGNSRDHRYSFWNVEGHAGTLAPADGAHALYLRVPPDLASNPNCAVDAEPAGRFEWIGCGSLGFSLNAKGLWISPGGDHVIYESAAPTTLEPCASPSGVTIYDRMPGGTTNCVSLLPNGDAPPSGAAYKGVSADGTAVAFTAGGTLYVRRDNAETLEIASGGAIFGGLSEGGDRVLYLKGGDVFACDLGQGGCSGAGAQQAIAIGSGGASTLVNVSADGSHVYFVSTVALSGAEENGHGAKAVAGEQNLYAWDGETVHFIAVVSLLDVEGEPTLGGQGLGRWVSDVLHTSPGPTAGPGKASSRSTSDGKFFAFQSNQNLTGFANDGHVAIFRYEVGAPPDSRLICVSCSPVRLAAASDARLQTPASSSNETSAFPPVNPITHVASLTEDGRRVFFQSGDRLASEDLDGKQDVYEWEQGGTGDCDLDVGCLSLISSGFSTEDEYLYSVTPDGSDVFFLSSDVLVPQDIGGAPSIYDAREGGGYPAPPPPKPSCVGETCQPIVSPSRPFSSATSGEKPGNPRVTPRRACPKGKRKVRAGQRVRCVRKGKQPRRKHPHRRYRAGWEAGR